MHHSVKSNCYWPLVQLIVVLSFVANTAGTMPVSSCSEHSLSPFSYVPASINGTKIYCPTTGIRRDTIISSNGILVSPTYEVPTASEALELCTSNEGRQLVVFTRATVAERGSIEVSVFDGGQPVATYKINYAPPGIYKTAEEPFILMYGDMIQAFEVYGRQGLNLKLCQVTSSGALEEIDYLDVSPVPGASMCETTNVGDQSLASPIAITISSVSAPMLGTVTVVIIEGNDCGAAETPRLTQTFEVRAISADYIPVIVEDSGTFDVEQYITIIKFYIDIVNNGEEEINVTITPDKCCLFITEDDIDCEIVRFDRPVELALGARTGQYLGNNNGQAVFLFRNLYTRYRKGNCTFKVTAEKYGHMGFMHTFKFDTTPDGSPSNCSAIDQDPDRECAPVDCAIKYKGRRNFYRSETGKCEVVVPCDTRGDDGVQIVAYYDWDTNLCHRLDFVDENTFSQVEFVAEIPAEIDPSQSIYFPEPVPLINLDNGDSTLVCNHGVQRGTFCDCEEGWMSSGINDDDPLYFRWCDAKMVDPSSIQLPPRKLSKTSEIVIIVVLSLINLSLLLLWFYVVYKLSCNSKCIHICCLRREPSYTLLRKD